MRRPVRLLLATVLAGAVGMVLFGVFVLAVRSTDQNQIGALQQQVTDLRQRNEEMTAQVDAGQRSNECRSRAAFIADEAAGVRDDTGWQALIDRLVAQVPLTDRPVLIAELNRASQDARQYRKRAITECTLNPNFVPPLDN